ncbi:MAG: METTL5 family protein, partial [Candidatus Daviesbacteria bacterium]|nr:METTL5 family protein [Candidatus Daviesbacteria bacterium]
NGVKIGSKKALAVLLSRLEGFNEPKVMAEQYATDSEVAAEVLWGAFMKGDIGKVSVDLGCGTGILGIGLLALGAERVYFVDSDEKVLETAKKNVSNMKSEGYIGGEAVFKLQDINDFNEKADLIVQNPPFGVKVKHMDKVFLKKAFEISRLVYSFHKSEGKGFVEAFSRDNGFKITDVFGFEFPLKATMNYHTRRIRRIGVSCFRIEKM